MEAGNILNGRLQYNYLVGLLRESMSGKPLKTVCEELIQYGERFGADIRQPYITGGHVLKFKDDTPWLVDIIKIEEEIK